MANIDQNKISYCIARRPTYQCGSSLAGNTMHVLFYRMGSGRLACKSREALAQLDGEVDAGTDNQGPYGEEDDKFFNQRIHSDSLF